MLVRANARKDEFATHSLKKTDVQENRSDNAHSQRVESHVLCEESLAHPTTPMVGDLPQKSPLRSSMLKLKYVVIEGCIGVGKTTLTQAFSSLLGSTSNLEVVEENPFLPAFYEDPVANAFKTQMFFLLSRFKQQEKLQQLDLFRQRVVSDYLFAKDRIFAELTLSTEELVLYDEVFNALQKRVQSPDLVIHLRAPLEVILERIERRGRDFEKDIDPEYLKRLVNAYSEFFAGFDACPVLTVDTEGLNFPQHHEDVELVLDAAQEVVNVAQDGRLGGDFGRQIIFA